MSNQYFEKLLFNCPNLKTPKLHEYINIPNVEYKVIKSINNMHIKRSRKTVKHKIGYSLADQVCLQSTNNYRRVIELLLKK